MIKRYDIWKTEYVEGFENMAEEVHKSMAAFCFLEKTTRTSSALFKSIILFFQFFVYSILYPKPSILYPFGIHCQ